MMRGFQDSGVKSFFRAACTCSAGLSRCAVLCLLPAGVVLAASSGPDNSACRDTTETLAADELAGYGIRLRVTATSGAHRVDLKLQQSVCIRRQESDCGTATYEFAEAGLYSKDSMRTLDTEKPNDYEYKISFNISDQTLERGTLRLTYRGERCSDTEFREHVFIVSLKEASKNVHGFF